MKLLDDNINKHMNEDTDTNTDTKVLTGMYNLRQKHR